MKESTPTGEVNAIDLSSYYPSLERVKGNAINLSSYYPSLERVKGEEIKKHS